MKPEFFRRGVAQPTRVTLRRSGNTIGPTRVDFDLLERIRIARRRLGMDEGVRDDG